MTLESLELLRVEESQVDCAGQGALGGREL